MQERRRYPRFKAQGVNCNVLATAEVDIINLSREGVSLLANVRLDINKEYALKLQERGKAIALRGEVVWSVLSGSEKGLYGERVPIYEAGVKFTNLTPEKTTELHDFIEHHKISSDERVVARFDIRPPEKTTLHYPFCYKVEKISLNGMSIKTERPFKVKDTFPIELFLPNDKTVKVYGRIASCTNINENETVNYKVGIEFLEISDEHKAMFREFVDTLQHT
jgi:hypothetical protein